MIDPRQIAKSYAFSSRFVIDLLAVFPIDRIADMIFQSNSSQLQLFGLFKLIRILRLGKIIAHMRAREDVKMSLKLVQLLLFLVMYIHLIACI